MVIAGQRLADTVLSAAADSAMQRGRYGAERSAKWPSRPPGPSGSPVRTGRVGCDAPGSSVVYGHVPQLWEPDVVVDERPAGRGVSLPAGLLVRRRCQPVRRVGWARRPGTFRGVGTCRR